MADDESVKIFSRDIHKVDGQFSHEVDERDHRKWRKLLMATGVLFCIAVFIVLIIAVTVRVEPTPTNTPIYFPASPQKLGVFEHAAAAVDAGPCSQIANDVMQNQGGSAVDAAIAGSICTGIINMYASGIGGSFSMAFWNQSTQQAIMINSRSVAPLASTPDMFSNGTSSDVGAFSIAVPGQIAGYWEVYQRFGRVPWRSLFEPTIKICRDGFTVSASQARGINVIIKKITRQPENKKPAFTNLLHFLTNGETGKYYVEGDTMFCSKQADTLERIANSNGTDFYNGSLAEDVLADLAEFGSPITQADLDAYKPAQPEPVNMTIGGRFQMITLPPPTSGILVGLILNILSGYKFNAVSSQDTLTYHRYLEALRFGFGQRPLLGDEDFEPEVKEIVKQFADPAWGEHLRSMIDDDKTHPYEYYSPPDLRPQKDLPQGTDHVSVVDAEGNAVAITSTTTNEFGSGIMGSRTGIIFNDEMANFDKSPLFGTRNLVAPGKRPVSSVSPAIFLVPDAERGGFRPIFVVGTSGGARIISGVSYVAMRLLWFDENPKEAVDALRLHDQLVPETFYYEPGMPEVILNVLRQKGHVNQTEYDDGNMSITQAVQILADGTKLAFSDYRKTNAFADGY